MNQFIKRFVTAGTILLVLFAVTAIPACHKDKPCKAIITVLDPNNNPISGATVRLDPTGNSPNPTISSISESTDASGKANFETELPKILDVVVIVGSTTYSNTGKVVRFEQGKTDEVTVVVP